MKNKTTISAQIPAYLDKKLTALAKAEKRSKSFFIQEALIKYLSEKQEDIEDYIEAEIRYKEFLETGQEVVPFDKLAKQAGI